MGIAATCFRSTVRLGRGFRISFPADDLATLMMLVVRLFLVAYFVVFLSLAGVVYTERWSSGAHVTPKMWAEHTEMMRLGNIDHHSNAPMRSARTDEGEVGDQRLSIFPVWNALSEFPLMIDLMPFTATFATLVVATVVVGRLRPIHTGDSFKEYFAPIPHRPPVLAPYS